MRRDWRWPQRLSTRPFSGVAVGGCSLCKSCAFVMIHPGSSGVGLKPRPLTCHSALFLVNYMSSQESFLLSAKYHNTPWAGKRGSVCPGPLAMVKVGRSDGGGILPLLHLLLRPGNSSDSIRIIGIVSSLKIWPQCLRSSPSIHSDAVLFCFIFKIKQTCSITLWQNGEASEC